MNLTAKEIEVFITRMVPGTERYASESMRGNVPMGPSANSTIAVEFVGSVVTVLIIAEGPLTRTSMTGLTGLIGTGMTRETIGRKTGNTTKEEMAVHMQ